MADLPDYGISQVCILGGTDMQPTMTPQSLSIENPAFDLNSPEAYDLLTAGAETPSGVRVNEEKSLAHPAVWQAVTIISGDCAGLPLEPFKLLPDGDHIKLAGTELYNLVHWQANEEMTAFDFWSQMIAWKLLWGNSYAYIIRRGDGSPQELVPLLPDRTAPERINGRLYCVTEVDGSLVPLHSDDVFHLRGLSLDGLAGYRFVQAARTVIGLGLAELGFASKFYRNGGRVGGILELPAAMGKGARDRMDEGFRKTYGSSEAFKTIVLREGAKFHQAQTSPQAAQVVEARQESVRDIARFFNIRAGKLNEDSRQSFASKAEDNRDHHDTTLRPHLRGITQECRRKLLTAEQKRSGHYFEHDVRAYLAMDFAKMSEALMKLRAGEVVSSDEARAMLNMNKRTDGRGGEYKNPNINVTSNARTAATGDASDEPAAQAFRQLLAGTVRRMARFVASRAKKLAAEPADFLAWIDDGYDGQRTAVTDAVGEVMQAAAQAIDINAAQVTEAVVRDFMAESHQILQTIASSTPAGKLRSVVEANMTEWAAEAGDRYAKQAMSREKA